MIIDPKCTRKESRDQRKHKEEYISSTIYFTKQDKLDLYYIKQHTNFRTISAFLRWCVRETRKQLNNAS